MARMRERCAIQLPMQPKHQRNHLIQQAETTLEKVTKRVHKEVPYIFVVLIKTQPTSLALWALSALPLHPRQTCRKQSLLSSRHCESKPATIIELELQMASKHTPGAMHHFEGEQMNATGSLKMPQWQQMGPKKKQKVTQGRQVIPGGCQRAARKATEASVGARKIIQVSS